MLKISELKKLFSLGGESGLIWKERPESDFATSRAYSVYKTLRLNKSAGCKDHRGYWLVGIGGKIYLAHRIVYAIARNRWCNEVDHINQDKSDNRPENLRSVSRSENIVNRKRVRAKSGFKNIYVQNNSYVVQLWKNRRVHHIGSFNNLEDAVVARNRALHALYPRIAHGC